MDVASQDTFSSPPSHCAGCFDRRLFLAGLTTGAATVADPASAGPLRSLRRCKGCRGTDPIGHIRADKWSTLVAFMEAHLHAFWQGCPADDPSAVACDALRYATYLTRPAQQAFCLSLTGIELYALKRTGRAFHRLSVARRRQLLNQGEYRGGQDCRALPLISWDHDYPLHTSIGSVAMLARVVTNSREPARRLIGFHWSPQCMDPAHLVAVPPAPYPNLDLIYDVCVVGSGAGGAVMAARAAEAGYRVIILEEGEWISPDRLVQRVAGDDGQEQIWPPRDDNVLMRMFQGAAVNVGGAAADPELERLNVDDPVVRLGNQKGLTFLGAASRATPRQVVNLVQPKVVGGGPYINNAIHLAIEEQVWQSWGVRRPPHVSYAAFADRMQQINQELGVTAETSRDWAGDRSKIFVQGCHNAEIDVEPLPVSILSHPRGCAGCGADNVAHPYGSHTGGLHPYRSQGPNSYLMRALMAGAQVAYETRALKFCAEKTSSAGYRAGHLVAEHRRGVTPNRPGPQITIRAHTYVVAAGALASTSILRKSLSSSGIRVRGLGKRLTANVATVVYAVFDKPICHRQGHRPEPGIAQCYYVKRHREGSTDEPTLENWFHFPGSLALALTGWFDEYVSVMKKYDHISICGMIAPTKVRPQNRIARSGRVHLSLDQEEFEVLLQGIRKIGRIYLAAATPDNGVTLYLPTKSLLLNAQQRPVRIRSEQCLDWALQEIRCRGPAFLNLATTHLMGGNSLGDVVHPETFQVQDCEGQRFDNLYVADASIFPAGCEVNPQLTVKTLAMYAADTLLARQAKVY